ncbi:uncharacterized protein LOC62_02G002095 [Vanrija pseudolonga]|uniref:Protein FAF1 n=1 Tax=Vanrija pseudolonga TaxID=143232 RepID=A0AAF0Y808_9TREE|nr:hypothetical protein LOC62_02G002095 [Vanrija pseudolonga]
MAMPTVKKAKKTAAVPVKPSKPAAKATNKKAVTKPPPRSNRAPESSDDDSGDDSDEDDDVDDKAAMLAALEAHGRAMFGFGVAAPAESSSQAAKRAQQSSDEEEDSDEEGGAWEDEEDDEVDEFDDGWGAGDDFVTDSEDEFATSSKATAAAPPAPVTKRVPEVVFAPTGSTSSTLISKAEKRAFLNGSSAKMMGLKPEDDGYVGRGKKRAREVDEEDIEDQSNLRLDKTLHDMLLKTLLPTAASDEASRPVEKRNAMSGRLLELASYSLPGEGTSQAKAGGMSQHPAAVRTGLIHAQQRRAEKARAEAEAAGSWVKGAGGLGDLGKRGAGQRASGGKAEIRTWGKETGKKKGMSGTKNERSKGLSMGFGKYERGALRVSEADIARVNNPKKSTGKKKGKGKMSGW